MPCNTFGPNDNYDFESSHFIAALIRKIYEAKVNYRKEIKIWGNGKTKRELIFVDDIADAIIFFVNKKTKESLINIGTQKDYSIKDFINLATAYLKLKTKWVGKGLNEKLILKKTNRPIITINSNLFRPSEVSALKGNSSKAKKDLKWSPKTNLKKLVKIMIDEELLHS